MIRRPPRSTLFPSRRSSDLLRRAGPLSAREREELELLVSRIAGKIAHPLTTHARASPHDPERQRSEEHTSELQSPCNLVCRLLLEKKKKPQDARGAETSRIA